MTGSLADLPEDPDTRLAVLGEAIVEHVSGVLPGYIEGCAVRIIDAWGRCDDRQRADAIASIAAQTPEATRAIVDALRDELSRPAQGQRRTPLQIVARVVALPTAVLEACGIPAVVRDPRDEAIHPDDIYDLTPRTLAALGDPDLGPLQMAWGLTKSQALRANGR